MKKKISTDNNKIKRGLKYSDEIPAGYSNGYWNIAWSGKVADESEKNISFDCRNFKDTHAYNFLAVRKFPMSLPVNSLTGQNSPGAGSRIIIIIVFTSLHKIRTTPGFRYFAVPFCHTSEVYCRVLVYIFRETLSDSHKSGLCNRVTLCDSHISMLCSSISCFQSGISLWYIFMEELLSRISTGNSRTAVLHSYVPANGSRVTEFIVRRTLELRELSVYQRDSPAGYREFMCDKIYIFTIILLTTINHQNHQ